MTNFTAIFDACALYPNVLRHLLMYLSLTDLFRAKWTEQIQDEWTRNVLNNYQDISPERLETTKRLMNENVRDALVSGFEPLIAGLSLPDKDDRHVLAAAIHSHAGVIVTFNLKDFPETILKPYGISAQHPDEFIANLIDLDHFKVCAAIRTYRASLKNPPKMPSEFLCILEKQGLVVTSGILKEMIELI